MSRRWIHVYIIAGLLLLTMLPACPYRPVDTQVLWTFNGECEEYGVDRWRVTISLRRNPIVRQYECTGPGDIRSDTFHISEDTRITVSVEALDNLDRVLAVRTISGEVVDNGSVNVFDVGTFTSEDFVN